MHESILILNIDKAGGKRKIFFAEECQLINVDRRIKIEKSPF